MLEAFLQGGFDFLAEQEVRRLRYVWPVYMQELQEALLVKGGEEIEVEEGFGSVRVGYGEDQAVDAQGGLIG
jgi:hypothetical protein